MGIASALFGSAPGTTFKDNVKLAALRALRTLIQGWVAAFPASGAGAEILNAGYWETVGYSALAAVIAAFVSFLQNIAKILPDDPTQTPLPPAPAPAPAPAPPAPPAN